MSFPQSDIGLNRQFATTHRLLRQLTHHTFCRRGVVAGFDRLNLRIYLVCFRVGFAEKSSAPVPNVRLRIRISRMGVPRLLGDRKLGKSRKSESCLLPLIRTIQVTSVLTIASITNSFFEAKQIVFSALVFIGRLYSCKDNIYTVPRYIKNTLMFHQGALNYSSSTNFQGLSRLSSRQNHDCHVYYRGTNRHFCKGLDKFTIATNSNAEGGIQQIDLLYLTTITESVVLRILCPCIDSKLMKFVVLFVRHPALRGEPIQKNDPLLVRFYRSRLVFQLLYQVFSKFVLEHSLFIIETDLKSFHYCSEKSIGESPSLELLSLPLTIFTSTSNDISRRCSLFHRLALCLRAFSELAFLFLRTESCHCRRTNKYSFFLSQKAFTVGERTPALGQLDRKMLLLDFS